MGKIFLGVLCGEKTYLCSRTYRNSPVTLSKMLCELLFWGFTPPKSTKIVTVEFLRWTLPCKYTLYM